MSIPLTAMTMGTGETGWEQGVVFILMGALMTVFPPNAGLPVSLILMVAAFSVITLLPLLPVPWPHRPDWWHVLQRDFGVLLPQSWSPQPFVTLEVWARVTACLVWLLWWVALRPGYEATRHLMRWCAGGIALLAAASLVFRGLGWEPVWWDYPLAPQFGPMANRNVFAALMSVGALASLAAAYDLQRRRHGAWWLFALTIVPMFASVVVNRSRAGIVLFLLGVVAWFATASLRRGVVQRMAIASSLLLAATAAVVLFGRDLVGRFTEEKDSVASMLTEDGRAPLFSEAIRLATQNPGVGAGLGNFSDVFGLTNGMQEIWVRFRHPESDWLWLLAETGFPATTLLGLLTGVVAARAMFRGTSGGEQHRGEKKLRMAAGLAGGVTLLHSFVNPVLHALPFFLVLGPIMGMALGDSLKQRHRLLPCRWLFRMAAAGLLAAGVTWFSAASGSTIVFGQTGQRAQLEKLDRELAGKDYAAAHRAANLAVAASPLNWEGYFDRATARLMTGESHGSALADFAIARYLEPSLFSLPMEEASIWLSHSPAHAISAWREALRRTAQEPQLQAGIYQTVLSALRTRPELMDEVRSLATTPQMLVHYLNNTHDEEDARETLRYMLEQHPSLGLLSSKERRNVFEVWYQRGDRANLLAQIKGNPSWMRDGWPFLARDLAAAGNTAAAYELALKQLNPPARLVAESGRQLSELERDASFNPNDPRPALALYAAQMEQGSYDLALRTLTRVQAMPTAPRYLDYEFARLHAARSEPDLAWKFMENYMRLNPDS